MASETSSAVLDLNDVDTTDTEMCSVADDREGSPLIMEPGLDIAVKVDAPMKQLSTLETYVTYRVRCVCARWPTPPYVRRRFNHFKVLHKRLSARQPLVAAPPLPPLHSARQQLDRYSPTFVAVRAMALDAFMERIAKHPILTHCEDFKLFLITPDEDFDKVFKSENSALNLWGLSSALYGSSEAKSNNGARVRDPEFTAAADYMQSLQHKLTTLCTLTNKLYKGSVSLSNEYSSLRRACDAWAVCGVGGAGCAGGAGGAGGAGWARAAGAVRALGAGGGAAAAARARAPLRHRAVLPLLAAYARAHLDKIRARDALHAAYVSGTNPSDECHNRLEQASEALRSELSDWIPKTRAEIKSLLLDLADRQVAIHSQSLMGWEAALKLSNDTDISELFKTVSKTAVQNLSPSKCPLTENDFDNSEIDSDLDTDKKDSEKESEKESFNGYEQDTTDRVNDDNDVNENNDSETYSNLNDVNDKNVINDNVINDDRSNDKTNEFSDPLQSFTDVELS
ncbi:sorting nexin-30-like [Zerene cesonia]|uniref:sorting nexin-30-like n=1 Tax=Zerene cesonia TaxID=33412 RepID=UPI0018E57293|nr:sorting nexin-30-like [Zerene cesonia]